MALVITNAAPTDKLNALKADVNIIARGKLVFLTILYVQVGYSESSMGYTNPYTLYSAGTYYPMFKIPKKYAPKSGKTVGFFSQYSTTKTTDSNNFNVAQINDSGVVSMKVGTDFKVNNDNCDMIGPWTVVYLRDV